MFSNVLSKDAWISAWEIVKSDFLYATWETIYVTVVATFFAVLIGLPIGIILVAGDKNGVLPMPKWLLKVLNVIINILRSVPFLILMMLAIPLTRALVGTSVGTPASIVPLVVASFPFVARLVESSLREVDKNVIEAVQSMGATPIQIIFKVMIPESLPSLINNLAVAMTTILGYSAMGGAMGGGGLGNVAIMQGYYRYQYPIMILAVAVLVVIVQLIQSAGTLVSKKVDKRLKNTSK